MSLDLCCDIRMVGSEFGINIMKAWVNPALCGGYFLGTLWALSATEHYFTLYSDGLHIHQVSI